MAWTFSLVNEGTICAGEDLVQQDTRLQDGFDFELTLLNSRQGSRKLRMRREAARVPSAGKTPRLIRAKPVATGIKMRIKGCVQSIGSDGQSARRASMACARPAHLD